MARLIFGGFEGQSVQSDGFDSITSSPVIDTTTKRSGTASMKITGGTTGAVGQDFPGALNRTFYARICVNMAAWPSSTRTFAAIRSSGLSSTVRKAVLKIDSSGRLIGADGTLSSPLATGTDHVIEVSVIGDGTNHTWQVRLNGVNLGSSATQADTSTPAGIRIGNVDASGASWSTTYFDDWAVNDDQGSNNNSWCGFGQVLALRPTADSAVGSDWKLGDATSPSSNAYDSVDNVPPAGVADSGASAGAQIRNAVNNITAPASDADFTMESYTAAGVPSGSTILATQARAVIGVAAAVARSMAVKLVSNPADSAEVSGNTGGTAAGTYPTGWQNNGCMIGLVQDAPTVTLGTAPVARVGKRSATTSAVLAASVLIHVEFQVSTINLTGATSSGAGSASGVLLLLRKLTGGSASGAGTASGVLDLITIAHLTGGSASASGSASGTLSYVPADLFMEGEASGVGEAIGFLGLDLPTRITETFKDAWKSGLHIGSDAPQLRVQIRQGRFNRRYAPWYDYGLPIDAAIGNSDPARPWQAFWEPTEPYVDVPNVLQVEKVKNFDQRGIDSASITIENVIYKAVGSGPTARHEVHRGYMSPLRGYVAAGRTALVDERGDTVAENEWFQKLNRNYQITVWEAYGDQWVKTFTGLIDDVDDTSNPATLVIDARSFGQVLSDEELFGWNKDKALFDPITFIDGDEADKITKVGHDAEASTEGGSTHHADQVSDGDSDTYWRSASHTGAGNTEYVQIYLPEGRYEDFWLGTEYPDLDVYVSLYAIPLNDGSPATRDGVDLPVGWVSGLGAVPGTYGGQQYVRLISSSNALVNVRDLDASYQLGAGSILRISVRNLYDLGGGDYRGAVRSLYGRKRTLVPEAITEKWVRVGDLSDIVKVLLRWAGFKEWEVESTGAKLGKRLVVNRQSKYMDVIDKIKDGVGYEFFVGDPTAAEESIGVPVFRKSLIIADDIDPVIVVTDGSDQDDGEAHLLTAVDVKQTDEPLAYIIRARGRKSKDGVGTGSDTTKRIQYEYRPPWSGLGLAGILKHVVHTNHLYRNMDDVKFAAWYIAIQEALESITVGIEIPAYPGVDLGDFVELRDLGTGLTTRLSIRERRDTFVDGEDKRWTMSLSGAIVDVPDLQEILDLVRAARRDAP